MRLLVLHSQPLVQLGWERLVEGATEWELLPGIASLDQGLRVLQEQRPQVVVVDDRLLGEQINGLLVQMRELAPASKILALVTHPGFLPYWADHGLVADGVLSAQAPPDEAWKALTLVAMGRRYLDPMLLQDWAFPGSGKTRVQLTRREHQVLAALGQGLTNREIAEFLVVSEFTVKKHVSHILKKLEVGDRTQAALYACHHGFGWPSVP